MVSSVPADGVAGQREELADYEGGESPLALWEGVGFGTLKKG